MTAATDPATPIALRMQPMLERGREAFRVYLEAIPLPSRPIGGATMDIVCEAEFLGAVELCFAYVRTSRRCLYILDAENDLSCLMAPFTWRR